MKLSKTHRAVVGTTVVFVVMIVTLRSMGRSWWCACGSVSPWSWDIWSSHASQHFIDPYFFTHILHGVIFFIAMSWTQRIQPDVKWIIAAVIEACWEIFETRR